jgi:purine-binding chemotaxis protein CheW
MSEPAETAFDGDQANGMALIVRLCGEALAIPVAHVHEVIDPLPRTRVPGASAIAPWLINVRGSVVPLVDIRHQLRMATTGQAHGRLVVLDLVQGHEIHRLALLADAVEEVLEIDPARIETLPEQGSPWPKAYVKGALRRGDDLVLMLDAETLFRPQGGTVQ